MIPTRNWDILINRLRMGDSILEACADSQVSKPTLYRRLGADHNFKVIFDEAIFHANDKKTVVKKEIQKKSDEDNMKKLKEIVLKKRH